MSAPQIPHLNSLRRGGGRGRGGRARGSVAGGAADASSHAAYTVGKDHIIQRTDLDAATSRLSAVETGYLDDAFAKLLTVGGDVTRRLPLMNRGTYVRTTAIDRLVEEFLTSRPDAGVQTAGKKKQVISLGAGSDTRFFRLKQRYADLDVVYHELDFAANTTAKIRRLRMPSFLDTARRLSGVDLLSPNVYVTSDSAALQSRGEPNYYVHAQDLRGLDLAAPARRREGLEVVDEDDGSRQLAGVKRSLPTLIVSECCLIYLSPEDADAVLSYFAALFPSSTPVGIVIYEPIRPHDAFGRTMVANLTARGIHLQTLNAHDTLEAQRERLRRHGFGGRKSDDRGGGVGTADVDFIWQRWIGEEEKERVVGLEWMDEVEEWKLLMRHYCVAWGWRDGEGQQEAPGEFEGWRALPVQVDRSDAEGRKTS